jgi:hypothetical protein
VYAPAAAGTLLASPAFLWSVVPIVVWAAVSAVHPFDLVCNYRPRHLTGTAPLPRRGAPSRFACGLGVLWLVITGWAFDAGAMMMGYVLGGMLTLVGLLVSTADICIPLLIHRSISVSRQHPMVTKPETALIREAGIGWRIGNRVFS